MPRRDLPRSTQDRFIELKAMMPHTRDSVLREAANLPVEPLTVFITTLPNSVSFSYCLQNVYAHPWFRVVAVLPRNSDISFLASLEKQGAAVLLYPDRLAGNLHKIRKWIEKAAKPPFIISDDDPGSSFSGGVYQAKPPRIIVPNRSNKCGAGRYAISAEYLCFLWCVAIFFGKRSGCSYVGLNGSEQQLSALPAYQTSGATPKRSFGTYGYEPFNYDAVVAGACVVLKPCRNKIPVALRRIRQEWSTASVEAIANHGGTFILMPVIMCFAVKPPKDAEADIAKLRFKYEHIVERGNSAGGRSKEEKTGCVVHLRTKRTYSNPRQ